MTTCLITGTNRGIGLELARHALARGWTVFGTTRRPLETETGGQHGDLIGGKMSDHPNFHGLTLDVTDRPAVLKVAAMVEQPIDILINNAGVIGPANERQTTQTMDFDGFANTLAINTLAPLAVAQAFLPHLRKSQNGRILTISSQMSSMGYAKSDRIAYRASKVAVNKVMQALATDLRGETIAVALINPGWVRTDMGGTDAALSPEEVAQGILEVANTLTMADTGGMIRWDGKRETFWET